MKIALYLFLLKLIASHDIFIIPDVPASTYPIILSSLQIALETLSSPSATIHLASSHMHNFTQTSNPAFILSRKEVTIQTLSCTYLTTTYSTNSAYSLLTNYCTDSLQFKAILHYDLSFHTDLYSSNLTFHNVILTGQHFLQGFCEDGKHWCSHCLTSDYMNGDSTFIERYKPTELELLRGNCEDFEERYAIGIKDSYSQLSIRKCILKEFRHRFKAFVMFMSGGKLVIEDSELSYLDFNIQGAFILYGPTESKGYESISVKLSNLSISRLNYDTFYKSSYSGDGGLIKLSIVNEIQLSNIIFQDLLIFTPGSVNDVGLIQISNLLSSASFSDLTFHNVMGGGLGIIRISISKTQDDTIKCINIPSITINSVSISNSLISDEGSYIFLSAGDQHCTISIQDLIFDNVKSAFAYSLLNIVFPDLYSKCDDYEEDYIVLRNIDIKNTQINSQKASQVINLENVKNIYIDNLRYSSDVGIYVDDCMGWVRDLYTPEINPNLDHSKVKQGTVSSMLNLFKPQNFRIENLDFNLNLGESWHKFVINLPYPATHNRENILKQVQIQGNGKLRRPMRIITNNEASIKITDSAFRESYTCLIFTNLDNNSNKASLILENTIFERCNFDGSYGASLIYQGAHLEVRDCSFRYNNSSFSGGIYYTNQHYLDQTAPSIFILENSEFIGNIAFLGVADLYIEAASGVARSKLSFKMNNCILQDSLGYFNIGSSVIHNIISVDSYIKNSKFINTSINDGAAIGFTYLGGPVLIENCEWVGNNMEHMHLRYNAIIIVGNGAIPNYITFNKCRFANNFGESIILIHNRISSPIMKFIDNLFEDNYSPLIEAQYSVVIDIGSRFVNNTAGANTILKAVGDSIVVFSGTVLEDNESDTQTAGFSLENKGNWLGLINVTMINNRANRYTCIFIDGNSRLVIENSRFESNFAMQDTPTLHIENVDEGYTAIIDSSIFIHNLGHSLISLYNANMKIMNSRFERNKAPILLEPAILMQFSHIELENNMFIGHTGNLGCYIMNFVGSIKDTNSIFDEADCEYGAFYMLSSTLNLDGSSFINSLGSTSIIYASKYNEILLKNTSFRNNTIQIEGGSLLYQDKGQLTLISITVHDFNKYAFHIASAANLIVKNSYIGNGGSSNSKGSGLISSNCQYLYIYNSTFENITSNLGGAIYVETLQSNTLSVYEIESSRFLLNTAVEYGALYLKGGDVNIKNSHFERNRAIGDTLQTYQQKGKGGALYLGCDEASWKCKITLSNNTFYNNSAVSSGGAIYWDSFEPDLQISNRFLNNLAEYGSDTASYPVALKILSINRLSSLNILDEVVSGQNIGFEVVIGLVDAGGQVIVNNNKDTAILSTVNTHDQLGGQTVVQAKNGQFIFKGFTLTAIPGKSTQLLVKTPAIDLRKQSKLRSINVNNTLTIHVNVRNCIVGEFSDGNACILCPQQTYSLASEAKICNPCPDSAECLGGKRIYPKRSYWRSGEYTSKFFKCPYEDACIGNENFTNLLGACAEGHEGNMCQVCKKGWSYSLTHQCVKCEKLLYAFTYIPIRIIIFIATASIILRQTLNEVNKPASPLKVYYKIFINFLQVSSIILTINLEWTQIIQDFFGFYGPVGDTTKELFSQECIIQDMNFNSEVFYVKLYAIVIYPFLMLVMTGLIFCCKSLYTQNSYYIKGPMVATFNILIFLIHPNVVSLLMEAFDCIEINDNEYWVKKYMNIQCWTGDHYNFALFIVLPGLIVWGFAVPFFSLYFLSKNRKELYSSDVKVKYGFMYSGYRHKSYYWEFVIMFRKVILIMIITFFSRFRVIIPGLLSLVLLIVVFYLQTYFRPFTDDKLNRLEEESILSSCVMVYVALFYIAKGLNETTRNLMAIATLVIQGYFLIHLFFSWLKEFLNQLIESFPMFFLRYFWVITPIRQKCAKVLYEKKNERLEMNKNHKYDSESTIQELPSIKEVYTKILIRKTQHIKYSYTMREADSFIY